ncbi:glycosyltransferase family 4 protein [Hydrotalea flava]|uniref:glycosyltransferase family 4 protein n=1 Tax=Hydrotalea flava TaxID=714549 RepID=UPI00082DE382|nr:glycosyltransferase family 4 protein [Hydrotalea flava]
MEHTYQLIAVSNPARQYTPQTVAALLQLPNTRVVYLTAFWWLPQRFFWMRWLALLPGMRRQLAKKTAPQVPENAVVVHITGILFSLLGRWIVGGEKRSFWEDRLHDQWVARWVGRHRPSIFIGYEKSAYRSFGAVQQYGGTCILDLAQVHPHYIAQLRQQYPFFAAITGSERLFQQVQHIKLQEYELVQQIWVLSDFAKATLLQQGIPEKKIRIMHLGVDNNIFIPRENYPERPVLELIFAGTVTERKGILLLLQLMERLLTEPVRLTILGPIGGYIQTAQLQQPNIRYIPYCTQKEMNTYFQAADVFVFPSYLDSWAMVVIEAMQTGLPVLVSEATGAKDAVTNGAGMVLPVAAIDAWEAAIHTILQQPQLIAGMGYKAAAAAAYYTWGQYHQSVQAAIGMGECLYLPKN